MCKAQLPAKTCQLLILHLLITLQDFNMFMTMSLQWKQQC